MKNPKVSRSFHLHTIQLSHQKWHLESLGSKLSHWRVHVSVILYLILILMLFCDCLRAVTAWYKVMRSAVYWGFNHILTAQSNLTNNVHLKMSSTLQELPINHMAAPPTAVDISLSQKDHRSQIKAHIYVHTLWWDRPKVCGGCKMMTVYQVLWLNRKQSERSYNEAGWVLAASNRRQPAPPSVSSPPDFWPSLYRTARAAGLTCTDQ